MAVPSPASPVVLPLPAMQPPQLLLRVLRVQEE